MALSEQLRSRFGLIDAVLAGCALVGLLLLLFVGPRLHPDAGVDGHIPRAEAVERARAFAEAAGRVDLHNAEAEASIRRRTTFLDSLQRRYGRPELIRRLRQGDLPAYYWRVIWTEPSTNGRRNVARVELTLSGDPIAISTNTSALSSEIRHDEALAAALLRDGVRDSIPQDALAFRFDNLSGEQFAAHAEQSAADPTTLGAADAVALARHHLALSGLGSRADRIDSVFVSSEEGLVTATVRVSTTRGDLGERFTADVELLAGGSLIRMEPQFHRPAEEREGLSGEEITEIATVFLFAVLALIMVVVFFRRITARLIDTKAAIRDGIVGGVAAAISMSTNVVATDTPGSSMETAVIIVGAVLTAFAAAGFMFFISGAATSVTRDRLADKLHSIDLARQLYVRNVPVGRALVRGVLAGLGLIGLGIIVLAAFPRVAVDTHGSAVMFGGYFPGFTAFQALGGKLFFALFATYTVIAGIGSLLWRRSRSIVVAAVGSALLLGMLAISPLDLAPVGWEVALSAVMGAVIVWTFWRFDALSALTTFFVMALSADVLPGLSLPVSVDLVNPILLLLVVGALLILGLVGVLSDQTDEEVPHVVPEYIEELAQRERLKRELELAREVQLSFLPARSPEHPGLDIASVCLPANEVGGDYYDFFWMDGRKLGVVVGDVSGKGMQAAFYMTLMKGILQSMSTSPFGPAEILSRANQLFRMNAPRGIFMSMIFGVFDVDADKWTFARAGHNPVLVHRASTDRTEILQPNGAAIGLASGSMFLNNLEEKTIHLSPGDLLLIYTDGITEAMDESRCLYDEERLGRVVAHSRGRTAGEVVASVIKDVEEFRGAAPRHDDMTMVAVRVKGR